MDGLRLLVLKVPVAILAALAAGSAVSDARAEMNMPAVEPGFFSDLTLEAVSGKEADRAALPVDGWPVFVHKDKGLKLKLGAPVPAVILGDVEWNQWKSDYVGMKFRKLNDRRVLYAYSLSPSKGKQPEKVLQAVLQAAKVHKKSKDEWLWIALGVEYDVKGLKLLIAPEFFRWAAVPVKWNDTSYELFKKFHDPVSIASLVSATSKWLPGGTYANFNAVEDWSGTFKVQVAKVKEAGAAELSREAIETYMKSVSNGPEVWQEMKPVASFIAVDRDLGIEGIEAEPIVTSKLAWGAMTN